MAENEKKSFSVDITSKAAEKAIDLAKDFLDKLIMPAVEELGLLMQDPIKIWRFNRQIKMLNNAREKCVKYNIKPKEIPVKLIFPLLEGASLEDDDYLLDKWSTLLANLVDSEKNITNHVFPYILSQISRNEFEAIDNQYDEHQFMKKTKEKELFDFTQNKSEVLSQISDEMVSLMSRINVLEVQEPLHKKELENLDRQYKDSELNLDFLQNHYENNLYHMINSRIEISDLQDFEIANLTRLGLVKEYNKTFATPYKLKIPKNKFTLLPYHEVPLKVELSTTTFSELTELGAMFIIACAGKTIDKSHI